jgi:hypothetical protein
LAQGGIPPGQKALVRSAGQLRSGHAPGAVQERACIFRLAGGAGPERPHDCRGVPLFRFSPRGRRRRVSRPGRAAVMMIRCPGGAVPHPGGVLLCPGFGARAGLSGPGVWRWWLRLPAGGRGGRLFGWVGLFPSRWSVGALGRPGPVPAWVGVALHVEFGLPEAWTPETL